MSILVKAILSHARGSQAAGVDGRLYFVHPRTGLLHEGTEASHGAAGCHEEDAAEFAKFTAAYKVLGPADEPAKAPPPPPPPKKRAPPSKPAAEAGSEEAEPDSPDSEEPVSDASLSPREGRRAELLAMARKQQKAIAKAAGLTGYTRLREADLVGLILDHEFAD